MNVTVTKEGYTSAYPARRGQTILTFLQQNKITGVETPCGGMGRCGKCKVQVEGIGEVLACKTLVRDGMHITIGREAKAKIAESGICHNHYPADRSKALVAACDIGTTTVVCHLIDGASGRILGTQSAPNAQRMYGADVVTRIQRAAVDLKEMQQAIVSQLDGMLAALCGECDQTSMVECLTVAGNTVMCHLLAGISPEAIGVAPFVPEELFGRRYDGKRFGFIRCREVEILPCVAGYVGADITADVLSVVPQKTSGQYLLLDIGTNGEMLLGNDVDGYVCCATAAGPAFEGAQIEMGMPAADGAISKVRLEADVLQIKTIGDSEAKGICGSGLLDALAVFLEAGWMDESGMLRETDEIDVRLQRYFGTYEGQACVWLTERVCVTQEDIRNLQLAKAAIAAGIQVLFKEKHLTYSDITGVFLAGGFGTFLDQRSAASIGLIPEELLSVTEAVGNAAGEGAILAAVSQQAGEKILEIRDKMKYLELSMHPDFGDIYMECMNFGK